MKPYTIEEFIKNGKGECFCPHAYYAVLHKTWNYHSPAFYSSDIPTKTWTIDGKNCIIFKNEKGHEYAIEISELQRLGILKKEEEFVVPEIFWVKVSEENAEILKKWSGITHLNENYIVGKYMELHSKRIYIGHNPVGFTKSNNGYKYDYGNELSFEDFKKYILKEEPMKITSLKEAYIVKCDTKEETNEVMKIIYHLSRGWSHWNYVINHLEGTKVSNIYNLIPKEFENLPILTFSKWKQLKDKEMNKDNKKIIGYKAPYDLFGKQIGKGVLYIKNNQADCIYFPKGNSLNHIFSMPKEIVETWEPVYEELEIKIPMANGAFELVIKDGKVWHKNENITNFVEEMVLWYNPNLSFGGYKALVDEITFSKTGCQNYTTSINEWINVHNKLHGK